MTARLRMVAGPNGSGKSSLVDTLVGKFEFGYLLNPDQVEKDLGTSGQIDLGKWGVTTQETDLRAFFNIHPLGEHAGASIESVKSSVVRVRLPLGAGYFAAVLCDFIRRRWLQSNTSFTFETVMSSVDKIDLLQEARRQNYRTYLYYVCTDSPLINQNRVERRVLEGGHSVPEKKITERYYRSLALLQNAISETDRAYLFDNSGGAHRLVAEFEGGKLKSIWPAMPDWFVKHALFAE